MRQKLKEIELPWASADEKWFEEFFKRKRGRIRIVFPRNKNDKEYVLLIFWDRTEYYKRTGGQFFEFNLFDMADDKNVLVRKWNSISIFYFVRHVLDVLSFCYGEL